MENEHARYTDDARAGGSGPLSEAEARARRDALASGGGDAAFDEARTLLAKVGNKPSLLAPSKGIAILRGLGLVSGRQSTMEGETRRRYKITPNGERLLARMKVPT